METITVTKIVAQTTKNNKPFRIVNDAYYVWDEGLIKSLIEGHTYAIELRASDNPKFKPSIIKLVEPDHIVPKDETKIAVGQAKAAQDGYTDREEMRQRSIEQQSAMHDFVALECAGFLDDIYFDKELLANTKRKMGELLSTHIFGIACHQEKGLVAAVKAEGGVEALTGMKAARKPSG